MEIEIQHIEGLNYSKALLPAMRAGLELLEAGKSEPIVTVYWDNNAVLALTDNKPIGVITWKYNDWMKTVNIYLGWVEPAYRHQGIYRKLWDSLVEKAKELGAKHISGTTHMDNKEMRATATSLGRKEISVNLSYQLT